MKLFPAAIVLALTITACNSKNNRTEPVISDYQASEALVQSDSASSVLSEPSKAEESPVSVSQSSPSLNPGKKPKQDNMRGFDPASEDDMDDNGMSRYMENNDEEGWD